MFFDLLDTDQAMPGTTGAELIEEAKRQLSGLRVLLVTGYAELPPGTATGVILLGKPFLTPNWRVRWRPQSGKIRPNLTARAV
jgi:CheY-like chemotaxis protein